MILKIPGKYLLLSTLILLLVLITRNCDYIPPRINIPDFSPSEDISPKKIDLNAVSKGEKILIHPIPWLNEQKEDSEFIKERKNSCKQNWQLKVDSEFDEFLEKCPTDIEAKIYSNNKKVKEKAANFDDGIILNIAIVVPISGNKKPLKDQLDPDFESEKKINGTRIFDSLEILKGIEIAQRESINGIQLGDKKVFLEVLIVDDSYIDNISVEQKAQESANYLVENKDIVAVIGHFTSDSIQATASIYNNNLVAFSPTSTAIRRNNDLSFSSDNSGKLKLNSYIFRTSPNDEFAINTLIDVIVDKNKTNNNALKSAMILSEKNNTYSRLYKQYFQNKFLDKINNSYISDGADSKDCQFYDNLSNNQKQYCIQSIIDNQPDLLLLVPSSSRALELAGTVLTGINNLEYKPQLLGADSMFDEFFLSDFAKGMIVSVPLKTIDYNNIQLSWRGAMTYDATKAIVKGIKNSKCDLNLNDTKHNIDKCLREQIKKVLSDKNFQADGILGKNTVFFENGDRKVSEALKSELQAPLYIKKVKDDKYTFELYF